MTRWTPETRKRAISLAPRGAHLCWPGTRIIDDDDEYRLITPGAEGGLNEVVCLRCEGDEADDAVARRLAEYRAIGAPWKWLVAFDSTPEDALRVAVEKEAATSWGAAGMSLSTAARLNEPAAARVEEASDLAAYDRAAAEAWGPSLGTAALERAIDAQRYRFFFVRERGAATGAVVAIAAYQAKRDGTAYFTSAYVAPAFRGQGLYRGLVERRLRAAQEEGLTLATTMARTATSAPILERLGFTVDYRFVMFAGS